MTEWDWKGQDPYDVICGRDSYYKCLPKQEPLDQEKVWALSSFSRYEQPVWPPASSPSSKLLGMEMEGPFTTEEMMERRSPKKTIWHFTSGNDFCSIGCWCGETFEGRFYDEVNAQVKEHISQCETCQQMIKECHDKAWA